MCDYTFVCVSIYTTILIKEEVINFKVRDGGTGGLGERKKDRNFVNIVLI